MKASEESLWGIHPLIRRLLITLFVVLIFVGIAYWKRSAIRQFGNEWNADRHLTKAEQELDKGAYSVALRRAITSLQLEPNRLDTIRVLAEAARETGDSRLLLIGQMLFTHEDSNIEDKFLALGAINDVGDASTFTPLWEQLTPEQQADSVANKEYARHLLVSGDHVAAIELLEELDWEASPELALLKVEALLRVEDRDEDAIQLSSQLLTSELDDEDKERLLARLSGLNPERIPAPLAAEIQEKLSTLSTSLDVDPTFDYTLRIAQHPEKRASMVQQASLTLQQDHLDPLSRWLMRLQESQVIVDSISEVQAYRSNLAYEARVRALIDLERLGDAFNLLQYPPDIADRIGVLIMKASVARALGRKSEETSAWQGALIEAERDQTQNHFLKLARFAQAAGEFRVAADALVAACRHPRGLLPPSDEIGWLFQYLIENDRPDDLLSVSSRFLRTERGNPVLLNNAIYLTVVLGLGEIPVDNLVAVTEELAEKHRGILGIRTTLALVYLMAEQSDKAYQVFKPEEFTGIGWQRFAASDRAIFAMVLEEHGSDRFASNVRNMIDWSEMLEAERIFFRKFLDIDDALDRLSQVPDAKLLPKGDGGDFRLRLLEQRRKAEREAAENNLSPRMILLQERLKEEKRAAAAGNDGSQSKVEMLKKRIEEERKALQNDSESERSKLLRERDEKEKNRPFPEELPNEGE